MGTPPNDTPALGEVKDAIRNRALALGFDAVGFARAELAESACDGLAKFLAAGHHGDMGWLAARAEERASPRGLWSDAKTVIVLGMSYAPETDPLAALAHPDRGAVSVYAQGRDYHDVVKQRLKALGRWIGDTWGDQLKVFVDTAPVMEKPLAEAAGLGWQGKHTNLVSRDFGSWLFLGEIYLDRALEPDAAEADHCGTCSRCLEICPTSAFLGPHRIDARRCISYLTIEHKGHIPAELRPLMGNRIYGCDDCLAVCPWNKFARAAGTDAFRPRAELEAPRLADLARLDDAAFRTLFAGSPVKRIGRDRFVRNVLVALGNSGDRRLAPVAEELVADRSPLVRAMAVWALGRLDPARFSGLRDATLVREEDGAVRDEWHALEGALA
jgi:epoxyqueuosine reductase